MGFQNRYPWAEQETRTARAPLPDSEVVAIRRLWPGDANEVPLEVAQRLSLLAARGYTYQAIAVALGTDANLVGIQVRTAREKNGLPEVDQLVNLPDVADLTLEEVRELTALETRVFAGRRGTPKTTSTWGDDKNRWESIIVSALGRGVKPKTIAAQLGLQHSIIDNRAKSAWDRRIGHRGSGKPEDDHTLRKAGEVLKRAPARAAGSRRARDLKWRSQTPESVPNVAYDADPFVVDPHQRDISARLHHNFVRQCLSVLLQQGARLRLPQHEEDLTVLRGSTLVVIEVKTMNALSASSQFRLGLGQVLEQRRQHRNDLCAGAFEAEELKVDEVAAVLVGVVQHPVQRSLPWDLWSAAAWDAEVRLMTGDEMLSHLSSRTPF